MNLYLDDDSADALLVRLLLAAGHEVQIPAQARLDGEEDPTHFKDNDPRRDLRPRGIVRATANLASSGVAITDQIHILNHWR